MRKFLINVNGNSYEVEVEEIGGAATPAMAAPAPVAAPAPKPAAAPVAPKATAQGTKVVAPMPGNILEVKASVGAQVAEGDVLCVLEAMKMENEILAPCAGKVVECNASKGATVETDAALFVIA